jgi:hypothetical protein
MFGELRLMSAKRHGSLCSPIRFSRFSPNGDTTMKNANIQTPAPRPIEPAAAYDNAHQISRDLLQHIELQLDRMLKPDHKALRWTHVRALNLINAQLSEVAALVDETNNARN